MVHGKQLIEDDVDTAGDGVFHCGLAQYGPFESDSHALRKDGAGDGIDVGLG